MTIDDLLNLEYSKDAIKKLDQFLAKTSKTDNNYLKVLCHKLEISPKVNDSLKEAYSYVISFNTMNDEEVISSSFKCGPCCGPSRGMRK